MAKTRAEIKKDVADFVGHLLTHDEERDFRVATKDMSLVDISKYIDNYKKKLVKTSSPYKPLRWPWYYPLKKVGIAISPKFDGGYVCSDPVAHTACYPSIGILTRVKWAAFVMVSPYQWFLKWRK